MATRANMPPLHHTKEVGDMRQSFRRNGSLDSAPTSHSSPAGSDKSYQSHHTQQTECSSNASAKKGPRVHYHNREDREQQHFFEDRHPQRSPKSSVDTYASTIHSQEDMQELPEYEVPAYTASSYESTAIPATPADFSELFPSRRRLLIRHDDSTLDGNMNLRLDTPVELPGGQKGDVTLFHLRLHDLKTRAYSLRRYCRDSGREVCHCARKEQKSSNEKSKRPIFQRSLSNALSSMRPKSSDQKSPSASLNLKRNDSGYGSLHSVETDDDGSRSEGHAPRSRPAPWTDTVRMEFSNYAQVDVKQAGFKASKRYEFEYWGVHYSWKRVVRRQGRRKDVSFHLIKAGSETVLGYIVPATLTPVELELEQSKGGWIPSCSMWIADEGIVRAQKDLSDVVVAAGLIALVDDAIKTRFHSERAKQITIPKLPLGIEYVGPRQLINDLFKRDSQLQRPASNSRAHTSDGSAASEHARGGVVRRHTSNGK